MNNNYEISQDMTLTKMLANSNSIEIPIIQRDYAQGRKSTEEIRNNFVEELLQSLKKDEKKKVDFVYGTHDGKIYVPYDGQQRLTLLYLITLFLSAGCEDWESVKSLSRFKYLTRDFATEFCRFLATGVDDGSNPFKRIDVFEVKISEKINDDIGFFEAWKNDPTVQSMLVVLDTIQAEFLKITEKESDKKKAAGEYLDILKKGNIFFDWCTIDAGDSIYIKMNGRGKSLSAFDNFKNTLYSELDKMRKTATQQDIDQQDIDKMSEYEEKMDGNWTDLFWKYRDDFDPAGSTKDIAPYMMNFIYYIFEYRFSVKNKAFFFGDGKESCFKWIDEKNIITFLSRFRMLCDEGKITISDYVWTSNILDILYHRLYSGQNMQQIDGKTEEGLFKELSSHKDGHAEYKTIIEASFYYAYLERAYEVDKDGTIKSDNTKNINQWVSLIEKLMRPIARFTSHNYDNLITKHIIKGFAECFVTTAFGNNPDGDLLDNPNRFGSEIMESMKTYFDYGHVYNQLFEEIEKYKLKSTNPAWEQELDNAEKKELPYFEGMINFLIEISKVNGISDMKTFISYKNALVNIINPNGIKDQNKFTAILLSFGDYRIKFSKEGGYQNALSLCSNGSKTFSWRRLFDVYEEDTNNSNIDKTNIIKSALDEIIKNNNDIVQAYNSVKASNNLTDWKGIIINNPDILNRSPRRIVHYSQDDGKWYLVSKDTVKKVVRVDSLYDIDEIK